MVLCSKYSFADLFRFASFGVFGVHLYFVPDTAFNGGAVNRFGTFLTKFVGVLGIVLVLQIFTKLVVERTSLKRVRWEYGWWNGGRVIFIWNSLGNSNDIIRKTIHHYFFVWLKLNSIVICKIHYDRKFNKYESTVFLWWAVIV